MLRKKLGIKYHPLYFLASLGAGGITASFFIYLMFMIDHPDTPLVTFNHIFPLLTGGSLFVSSAVAVVLVLMVFFAFTHFKLLRWNIKEYRAYKKLAVYEYLRNSNAEVSLMAIPLTLAMSINVMFILGVVFVPNLWNVAEYLFPFAIAGFLAVGAYALKIFFEYFARLFLLGNFDFAKNNNLSQMVAIFAFAMIAVGLAAPGAMSHYTAVNAIGLFFAIFFASLAILLALIKLTLGFSAMMEHGIDIEASPSLWVVIPILTLLGITFTRVMFGLHHGFDAPVSDSGLFVLTATVISLQILFGLFGYFVMNRLGYFSQFLRGDRYHPGSYALICPGVALFVFGMFFIVFGLLKNGVVEEFSYAYFAVLAPFVFIQLKTIIVFFALNKRLLRSPKLALSHAATN